MEDESTSSTSERKRLRTASSPSLSPSLSQQRHGHITTTTTFKTNKVHRNDFKINQASKSNFHDQVTYYESSFENGNGTAKQTIHRDSASMASPPAKRAKIPDYDPNVLESESISTAIGFEKPPKMEALTPGALSTTTPKTTRSITLNRKKKQIEESGIEEMVGLALPGDDWYRPPTEEEVQARQKAEEERRRVLKSEAVVESWKKSVRKLKKFEPNPNVAIGSFDFGPPRPFSAHFLYMLSLAPEPSKVGNPVWDFCRELNLYRTPTSEEIQKGKKEFLSCEGMDLFLGWWENDFEVKERCCEISE
ncbi:hypothetical protein HDU76_003336 [Blyttiomyces sp. JEL0837]|nr:hypothetical protein HDU76_003336 [Blyttiomyces sp. JEL0837]